MIRLKWTETGLVNQNTPMHEAKHHFPTDT